MKKHASMLLALCLCLCLAVLLAACGGAAAPAQSTAPAAPAPAAGSTAAPAEPAASEPVELVFFHSMDSVYAEVLDAQVALFNSTLGADNGITVVPVFQDWPGTEALTAAMAAEDFENMPDVIQLYGEHISLIRDYDRTVWAEDFLGNGLSKEDLIPNAVSTYSIGGRMIGVPYNVSALMLYYNKTYLQQAGFDAPPATIAEMAEMLPVIVESTDAEFGLNVRINQYELENFIATQGADGSYFGNNESGHTGPMTEFAAATDGTLEAYLNEWAKLAASGAYKPIRDSINEEFAAGMHGMVIMTSSRIRTIAEMMDSAYEWDVAPIPTVSADDKGGAFPSGAGLFMLNRGDDAKVQASWQFVQFMAGAEAQAMWLEKTGYIPVNVYATDTEAYKAAVASEPRLEAPYNLLMASTEKMVAAFTPNASEIDGVVQDTMIQLGEGTIDAATALQTITDGVARAMEDYYRANPIE